MSHILSLGAFNVDTDEYVHPRFANKKDKYKCPDCGKGLILVQGNIRIHHFRHKKDSVNPCNHYSNPTESQIHKDAKMLIKSLLERKIPISFNRKCVCCEKVENHEIPEISETSVIQEEWSFDYNGLKIADVAYLEDGERFCLFEIYHTHKTRSEDRPEPWFEINAETLIQMVNDNATTALMIPCIRVEKCEVCIEKEEANRIVMEARRMERMKEMEEERKRREEERKKMEEERKRREEEKRLKIIKQEEERKKEEDEKRLKIIKQEEERKKREEERKKQEEERKKREEERKKQEESEKISLSKILEKIRQKNLRIKEERSNELRERINMKEEDERRKEIKIKENKEKEEIRQKNIRNQMECSCGIRFMYICNCCEPVFEYKENLNYHWCKKCRKRKDICLETNSQLSSR